MFYKTPFLLNFSPIRIMEVLSVTHATSVRIILTPAENIEVAYYCTFIVYNRTTGMDSNYGFINFIGLHLYNFNV